MYQKNLGSINSIWILPGKAFFYFPQRYRRTLFVSLSEVHDLWGYVAFLFYTCIWKQTQLLEFLCYLEVYYTRPLCKNSCSTLSNFRILKPQGRLLEKTKKKKSSYYVSQKSITKDYIFIIWVCNLDSNISIQVCFYINPTETEIWNKLRCQPDLIGLKIGNFCTNWVYVCYIVFVMNEHGLSKY